MRRPLKQYAIALVHALQEPGMIRAHVEKNFVRMLARDGVLSKHESILRLFAHEADRRNKIATATIATARVLSPSERQSIELQIARAAHADAVKARYTQDSTLVGGAVVQIGDMRIDGSIRGHLIALRSRIKK